MYLFDAKVFPTFKEWCAYTQSLYNGDPDLFEVEGYIMFGVGYRLWVWLKEK